MADGADGRWPMVDWQSRGFRLLDHRSLGEGGQAEDRAVNREQPTVNRRPPTANRQP
jgi:hypothetical protein